MSTAQGAWQGEVEICVFQDYTCYFSYGDLYKNIKLLIKCNTQPICKQLIDTNYVIFFQKVKA